MDDEAISSLIRGQISYNISLSNREGAQIWNIVYCLLNGERFNTDIHLGLLLGLAPDLDMDDSTLFFSLLNKISIESPDVYQIITTKEGFEVLQDKLI